MSVVQAGTHVLTYGSHDHDDDEEEEEEEGEEKSLRRRGDPCFHYTVLDQAWRATNTTSKFKMCDRNVKWKGRSFSPHGRTCIRGILWCLWSGVVLDTRQHKSCGPLRRNSELIKYNSADFRNKEIKNTFKLKLY